MKKPGTTRGSLADRPDEHPKLLLIEKQKLLRKGVRRSNPLSSCGEGFTVTKAKSDPKRPSRRVVSIGVASRGFRQPAIVLGNLITEALDPVRQPGKVRTLADMTPEQKAALEAQYGMPIATDDVRKRTYRAVDYYIESTHDKSYILRHKTNAHKVPILRSLVDSIDADGIVTMPLWYAKRRRILKKATHP